MATRIREKAAKRKEQADKRPYAIAKFVHITPAKIRIVLDLIRGKDLSEALVILSSSSNLAAEPIKKVVDSAAANAENNKNMPKDFLYIAECFANQGYQRKKLNPRAKGRANIILKKTAHITIILDSREQK